MGAAPSSQDVLFGDSEGEVLYVSSEQRGYPIRNVTNFSELTNMWYAGRATPKQTHFFEIRFDVPSTVSAIEMSPLPDDSTLRMHRVVARAWVKHSGDGGGGYLGPWTELMPWRCSRQNVVMGIQPCHDLTFNGALAPSGGRVPMCGFEFFATDSPTWIVTKSSKEGVLHESLVLEQHAQVFSCFAPGHPEFDGAGPVPGGVPAAGVCALDSLGEFGMMRVEVRHETKTTRGCLAEIGLVGFKVVGTASAESGAKAALDAAVAKIAFGPRGRMSGNDGDEGVSADADAEARVRSAADADAAEGSASQESFEEDSEGEVVNGGAARASDAAAAARARQRAHMQTHGVVGDRGSVARGDSIVHETCALVRRNQLMQTLSAQAATKKLQSRQEARRRSAAAARAKAQAEGGAQAATAAAETSSAAATAGSNLTRWRVTCSRINARATATLPGTKSGGAHERGEVVEVSATLTKAVGAKKVLVTFLELANGEGWLFDRIAKKPNEVLMVQVEE